MSRKGSNYRKVSRSPERRHSMQSYIRTYHTGFERHEGTIDSPGLPPALCEKMHRKKKEERRSPLQKEEAALSQEFFLSSAFILLVPRSDRYTCSARPLHLPLTAAIAGLITLYGLCGKGGNSAHSGARTAAKRNVNTVGDTGR